MRRTLVALLAVTALVAACEQSAERPAAEPAGDAAPTPVMPADAPPQEEVDPAVTTAATPAGEPGSCRAEIGEAAAIRLVERCVMVSPASHPPCHPDNPCTLIQGEIDRSCAMYGPDETRPPQCGA